jgi:predicted ferric reductase
MEITTARSSRIDALKSSSASFAKALRWSDANPIEERLALTSVARSGFFLLAPSVIIASAIVAWALLLATRSRILEWSFGGFDRLHVWHRWAGTAAIVFLFLHTSSENNTRNGQTPFGVGVGVGVEEAGLVFASPAQVVLVTLVIISILRVLPYRIWRFSHLAIFVPFLFSGYHALTAERPLSEYDLTGYWLWFWSIVGVASFVYRVLVVDSGALDKRAVVTSVLVGQKNVRLTLSRAQGWPRVKPGQFFYVRIGGTWREAHPFSIVQNDQNPLHVSVEMRKTGDWTDSVAARAVVGDTALVSRSYGHFRLQGTSSSTVWVAGVQSLQRIADSCVLLPQRKRRYGPRPPARNER